MINPQGKRPGHPAIPNFGQSLFLSFPNNNTCQWHTNNTFSIMDMKCKTVWCLVFLSPSLLLTMSCPVAQGLIWFSFASSFWSNNRKVSIRIKGMNGICLRMCQIFESVCVSNTGCVYRKLLATKGTQKEFTQRGCPLECHCKTYECVPWPGHIVCACVCVSVERFM